MSKRFGLAQAGLSHTNYPTAMRPNINMMSNEMSPDAARPSAGPHAAGDDQSSAAAHITSIAAENKELRAQLDQLRAECNRLAEVQRCIMEALGTVAPEKIIHDLRNVLNERDLLKAFMNGV